MRYNLGDAEAEFSLKAYAISNGTKSHLWEVTPQKFEHGEDVVDTKRGRLGQVIFTRWDAKLEGWRYCIRRKDIDNEGNHVPESDLAKAPAQTRIDNGKTILYAPRKLRLQLRRRRTPKLDKSAEYFVSKQLFERHH